MRWDQRWQSVKRLEDTDGSILAETCHSQGKWHLFLCDGRKSVEPHFMNPGVAMREAERLLKVEMIS